MIGYPQELHDALEALPPAAAGEAAAGGGGGGGGGGLEPSDAAWAKWASGATGRAQFSEAISLVQGWAGGDPSDDDGPSTSTSGGGGGVEAVISEPGKIGECENAPLGFFFSVLFCP